MWVDNEGVRGETLYLVCLNGIFVDEWDDDDVHVRLRNVRGLIVSYRVILCP